MRRVAIAALFLSLVFVKAEAQPANYALADLGQGNVFEGCLGPFCVDPVNQEGSFLLNVVCVDRVANPDRKELRGEIKVVIPDNTGLAGIRTLWTTGVVTACAQIGITVPRTNVILPVLQFGI